MTWLDGQSLVQSIFICMYCHNPYIVEDTVLKVASFHYLSVFVDLLFISRLVSSTHLSFLSLDIIEHSDGINQLRFSQNYSFGFIPQYLRFI